MSTRTRLVVLNLSVAIVLIGVLMLVNAFVVEDSSAQSAECYPVQIAPFLQPPYYGTVGCSSVYDHEYPRFWREAEGANPGDAFLITSTVVHYDSVRHWGLSYSGHNGIDYLLRYDPVRAAAPGQVVYAGWDYPGAHATGIGLYVHMRHSNDYDTLYGHMSVLRVRTDDEIHENNEFQRILGISGNTGESTGPHLHFELEPPGSEASVNPYGWTGVTTDPWETWSGLTSHDVWLRYPSLTSEDLYPSDDPLSAPPIVTDEEGQFTIDDGSTNFTESPSGCWTVDNTDGWINDYRRRDIPGNDCTATWTFPYDQPRGRYHVFVHVPNFWDPAWPQGHVIPTDRLATVDAAWYEVLHTPSASQLWPKQSEIGIVNQLVYPNGYYTSPWTYLGTYYFNSNMQHGADRVVLETETISATGRLVADAVRFVPLVYRIYLPLVTKRWPPIPDTPVLNPIDNSDHDADYTVSWNPAYLADTYILQEASNSDFAGAVTRYSGTQTALDIYSQDAGTYYYCVKATNSWGDSGWSNVECIGTVFDSSFGVPGR